MKAVVVRAGYRLSPSHLHTPRPRVISWSAGPFVVSFVSWCMCHQPWPLTTSRAPSRTLSHHGGAAAMAAPRVGGVGVDSLHKGLTVRPYVHARSYLYPTSDPASDAPPYSGPASYPAPYPAPYPGSGPQFGSRWAHWRRRSAGCAWLSLSQRTTRPQRSMVRRGRQRGGRRRGRRGRHEWSGLRAGRSSP